MTWRPWIRFVRENRAIAALAHKFGMRIVVRGGEGDAWLDLPPPARLTYTLDRYESQLAFVMGALHGVQRLSVSSSGLIVSRSQ